MCGGGSPMKSSEGAEPYDRGSARDDIITTYYKKKTLGVGGGVGRREVGT